MKRPAVLLLCAALAGAASAGITVNGTPVSAPVASSGDGWSHSPGDISGYPSPLVRLTGPGPFVVSGTDVSGTIVLRAEADCTVVVSNLVLSNAGTGYRLHWDGIDYVLAAATNGAGRAVAVFPEGLFHSSVKTGVLLPDDPAAAFGSAVFAWSDVWDPSNVLWERNGTNNAAVAWTGERFVAARRHGGFMVSEDGAEWRAASWNGTPNNLRAVARDAASGTLVAASTKGLWRSVDGGLSWTQATNLYSNAVIWKDGLFVAVGTDDARSVYWSADGAAWRARSFSGFNRGLDFVIAGGDGRFLAGGPRGWLALHFENGEPVSDGTVTMSASKYAVASDGNGNYVACAGEGTGLRESRDGLSWTRSDVTNSTFYSIVFRQGQFVAEGIAANGRYVGDLHRGFDGCWARPFDDCGSGYPALLCGTNAVKLVVAGTGNRLAGGPYAAAVSVAPGGSLELSAADSGPAAIDVRGGCFSSAIGGGWFDYGAGAFVQRGATLFAKGGSEAPDVGPGMGNWEGFDEAGIVTVLGGSLRPSNGFFPAPSNGVEAVRLVVVEGLAPGAAVSLANLPAYYGTDGIVADANGRVWLWLPASAESFRFIAGGSLRRVAAGGGNVLAETLPDPKVEGATFAPAADGAMEVTLRVSSPVEAGALAPVYATDLSALSSGGERLEPESVEQVGPDEYELTFRLPSADSGFLVIQAK